METYVIDMDGQNTNVFTNGIDGCHKAYIELFNREIERQGLTVRAVAVKTGINRTTLARILEGKGSPRYEPFHILADVLGIDQIKLIIAAELLGNVDYYYEPAVANALALLEPTIRKLIEAYEGVIDLLSYRNIDTLSGWLAGIIIENQKQLCLRRDELPPLPKL
jgi:transcriptional regulator with XRE-family HTH domain